MTTPPGPDDGGRGMDDYPRGAPLEGGAPGYPPPAGYPQYGAPPPGAWNAVGPVPPRTNALSIASLVTSIAGAFLCIVPGIVGFVLGLVALSQIKRTGEDGRGMAIAGVAVGAVCLTLVVGYVVFFSIAVALGV